MAAGTPVLASRIPGYANVLTHGREGFLAEPKNPASIAAGLIRLLSDRELRAWIKEAGQRTARQYDWPVIASRLVSYYERTMLNHKQTADSASTTPRRRRRRTLQEIIGT
jgi:phosphatidylinositol alpha-mannosyltransferase